MDKQLKTLLVDGKDLFEITDYKTLLDFKTKFDDKNAHQRKQILYLSPNDINQKKYFETEFIINNMNEDLLNDSSLLRSLFKDYNTMELKLYFSAKANPPMWFRYSFLDALNDNVRQVSFL